jgi:hypothetical protein
MDSSENENNNDLGTNAIPLIIGASNAIAIKARYLDSMEFGLGLKELANLVDKRINLRCLLPLPVVIRDRNGALHKEISTESSKIEAVRKSIAIFNGAGWEIRLMPGIPLVSSLSIDRDFVFYYEYLNDPPGPFLSSAKKDTDHYLDQFEEHWKQSIHISDVENLYEQITIPEDNKAGTNIAIISSNEWEEIIRRLSLDPTLMLKLPARKFEELVAEFLNRDGLEVYVTPESRDGGRDILAFAQTPIGRHLYLVECKRYSPDRPVGISIVQRLYGVVTHEKATAGLIVTTSRFSATALAFAETNRHQIGLKDYNDLKNWLKIHSNF